MTKYKREVCGTLTRIGYGATFEFLLFAFHRMGGDEVAYREGWGVFYTGFYTNRAEEYEIERDDEIDVFEDDDDAVAFVRAHVAETGSKIHTIALDIHDYGRGET